MRSAPLPRRTPLARHTPPKRKTPLQAKPFSSKVPLVGSLVASLRRAPMRRKAPKAATVAEKAHLDAVQALGCLVCGAPALIHHVRSLNGIRMTRNHAFVLPLCWGHHSADSPTGFHAGSRSWQELHGSEAVLLDRVSARLGGSKVPAWAPCADCGEMVCAIHACHTGDSGCECPGTEVWDEIGLDPYAEGGRLTPEALQTLIEVTHG